MGATRGPAPPTSRSWRCSGPSNTALFWNRIAIQASTARHLTFAENAHLFALLNLARWVMRRSFAGMAKYRHVLWRPITAVREAQPRPDPTWRPWIESFPAASPSGVTLAHPEFPSGHSTLSGAAAAILGGAFGDNTPFTIDSDVRPGTRAFPSFSAALAEIHDDACLRRHPLADGVPRRQRQRERLWLNTCRPTPCASGDGHDDDDERR